MFIKKLYRCNDDGFSLIELAIVLLVIGLIIGGILKGQELIDSARLISLRNQIREYCTATNIFRDKYGSLPGDYDKAQEYIDEKLKNGNHNGIIDNNEAPSFWAHLAAENLIAMPDTPEQKPTTRLGGVVTVHYGDFGTTSHWFVVGTQNGDEVNGALLTPAQAMNIDQKIDNGNPLTGDFRATDSHGVTADQGKCLVNNKYNLKNTKPACVVYFRL